MCSIVSRLHLLKRAPDLEVSANQRSTQSGFARINAVVTSSGLASIEPVAGEDAVDDDARSRRRGGAGGESGRGNLSIRLPSSARQRGRRFIGSGRASGRRTMGRQPARQPPASRVDRRRSAARLATAEVNIVAPKSIARRHGLLLPFAWRTARSMSVVGAPAPRASHPPRATAPIASSSMDRGRASGATIVPAPPTRSTSAIADGSPAARAASVLGAPGRAGCRLRSWRS